jgi:hypothetical protein
MMLQGLGCRPSRESGQEADVDSKICLYGVIEAFRQGRMPDNKQIEETLLYVQDTSPVDVDKLSQEGQKLIQDSCDIIETARWMVQEKNADELLPVDKSKAKEDGQTGALCL